MSEIDAQIHALQQSYPREAFQTMFVERTFDDVFEHIGQDASGNVPDKVKAIWNGYELLSDSKYLPVE